MRLLLWALLIVSNYFFSNTTFRRSDMFPSTGVRDFIFSFLNNILLVIFCSYLQLMMTKLIKCHDYG
jgi:hypothetical protein